MQRRRRALKHYDIYVLDKRRICKYLADMTLYDYLPKLEPLKYQMLHLSAKATQLKETSSGAFFGVLRDEYDKIIKAFGELFSAEDLPAMQRFLLQKWYIDADAIVFDSSPY